jgi:hypothetical protein
MQVLTARGWPPRDCELQAVDQRVPFVPRQRSIWEANLFGRAFAFGSDQRLEKSHLFSYERGVSPGHWPVKRATRKFAWQPARSEVSPACPSLSVPPDGVGSTHDLAESGIGRNPALLVPWRLIVGNPEN